MEACSAQAYRASPHLRLQGPSRVTKLNRTLNLRHAGATAEFDVIDETTIDGRKEESRIGKLVGFAVAFNGDQLRPTVFSLFRCRSQL
jgi:hypothetical protein